MQKYALSPRISTLRKNMQKYSKNMHKYAKYVSMKFICKYAEICTPTSLMKSRPGTPLPTPGASTDNFRHFID